jgi:hypothetical protein
VRRGVRQDRQGVRGAREGHAEWPECVSPGKGSYPAALADKLRPTATFPLAELQGIYTAQEIHTFLQEKGNVDDYPLFKAVRPRRSLAPQQPRRVLIALLACSCQVYEISFEGRKVETLTDGL